MNSIFVTFRRYFRFKGRAGRREFWTWVLMMVAVSVTLICTLAGLSFILDHAYNRVLSSLYKCILISLGLFWLVMFIPSLTVTVRRMRDAGISAWLLLIPAALCIFTFLVLFDVGLSNMDGTSSCFSDAMAFILSGITAMTCSAYLLLFCLPSKVSHTNPRENTL